MRSYPFERGAMPGPTALRPITDEERLVMQRSVDATYERFLEAIVQGRGEQSGLDKEQLRAVADGRVWTGRQAFDKKLVDKIGGVLEAVAEARRRAGIADDEEIALDVLTGSDDDLVRLTGLARVLAPGAEGLSRAVRLLLGDPEALSFALESEGRPLAVAPMRVRLR